MMTFSSYPISFATIAAVCVARRSGLEMIASTVTFSAARARPTSWDCSIPSWSSGRFSSLAG